MPENDHERDGEQDGIRKLISGGSEIAGSAVAGALGFFAAGPVGAALLGGGAAAAAMALRHIGQEASERLLGPREKARLGGVLALAAAQIHQRIQRGEEVRSDDFFEEKSRGRSDAEEVAESVLLKSQREPEEKKLVYMSNLLANVAFDQTISAQMAHQITKIAEALTYRQLCILKLAMVKQAFPLRGGDYRGQGSFSKDLYQILYECVDLYHRGLINFGGEVAFGPTDVKPSGMAVQGVGADLVNLMGLANISNDDLLAIVAQLK